MKKDLHFSVYCLRSCKPLNPSVRKYRVVKTSVLISKFVRSRQAVHVSGRSGWEHELFLQSQSDLTDVFLSSVIIVKPSPQRLQINDNVKSAYI